MRAGECAFTAFLLVCLFFTTTLSQFYREELLPLNGNLMKLLIVFFLLHPHYCSPIYKYIALWVAEWDTIEI